MKTGTLHRAITAATYEHEFHTDKNGAPYILHPLRVMIDVAGPLGQDTETMITAVLHDVCEDADQIEPCDLGEFGDNVVAALELLTRAKDEKYPDYISRIKNSKGEPGRIAKKVKHADLRDNLSRLSLIDSPHERESLKKRYEKAAIDLIG